MVLSTLFVLLEIFSASSNFQNICEFSFLHLLGANEAVNYESCYNTTIHSVTFGELKKAGTDLLIDHKCACQSNYVHMKKHQNGCCELPRSNFVFDKHVPFIVCDYDCSLWDAPYAGNYENYCTDLKNGNKSTEFAQCQATCSPYCFEVDNIQFDLEKCKEGCVDSLCVEYAPCIVYEYQKNQDQSNLPNTDVCAQTQFNADPRVENFLKCLDKYSHLTRWHYDNAIAYCSCLHDLKAASEAANCCDNTIHKTQCNEIQCSNQPECSSVEANVCRELCTTTCPKLWERTNATSTECEEKCLSPSSSCSKYLKCDPSLSTPQFTYKCSEGDAVGPNGCCQSSSSCPIECQQTSSYYIASRFSECECSECGYSLSSTDLATLSSKIVVEKLLTQTNYTCHFNDMKQIVENELRTSSHANVDTAISQAVVKLNQFIASSLPCGTTEKTSLIIIGDNESTIRKQRSASSSAWIIFIVFLFLGVAIICAVLGFYRKHDSLRSRLGPYSDSPPSNIQRGVVLMDEEQQQQQYPDSVVVGRPVKAASAEDEPNRNTENGDDLL